ncbi:hypothetical protein ACFE04_027303 [Oxalis oulophora]
MASTTTTTARMDSSSPSSPPPCANNCGFFGSTQTMNFCSKCYKDYLKTQQESAPVPVATTKPEEIVACSSSESTTIKNRCQCCNKKLGLTGFKCRCGQLFCGSHRYPKEHSCSFDFKEADRQILVKQNPLIKGDKLDWRI